MKLLKDKNNRIINLNYKRKYLFSQICLKNIWHKHMRKCLHHSEQGSVVLEVVIVIAVIIAVALIFNKTLKEYANSLINVVFGERSFFDSLKPGV
ncbi:hypothetical protein PYS61_04920 [Amygdalobacter indicium]|jgi:hypothetical protein|uniref:Flagellin Flp1-like domain-containing protein n=1 Tax=Amygdalobacter indicium TaxID=3029272 RepID=A0ABY8C3M1_9FIRM|nr:hypothetical protein [Amygdalobacter indicium]WEG34901.1 hypothetical protein PYS60_03050 [Amygdalobacter indicium]WEG35275.1 hypothetical protein PYS61_04920 [Amygdalobacter indicium]